MTLTAWERRKLHAQKVHSKNKEQTFKKLITKTTVKRSMAYFRNKYLYVCRASPKFRNSFRKIEMKDDSPVNHVQDFSKLFSSTF